MKTAAILFSLACATLTGCFANSEECSDNADCIAPPAATLPEGGSCASASICDIVPPQCPDYEVPIIVDSCYTGDCIAVSACDVAPICDVLNTEDQCEARAECESVYGGINCRDPEGNVCTSGSGSNCTCESFVFARCATVQ